jgi:hypothetical protein
MLTSINCRPYAREISLPDRYVLDVTLPFHHTELDGNKSSFVPYDVPLNFALENISGHSTLRQEFSNKRTLTCRN